MSSLCTHAYWQYYDHWKLEEEYREDTMPCLKFNNTNHSRIVFVAAITSRKLSKRRLYVFYAHWYKSTGLVLLHFIYHWLPLLYLYSSFCSSSRYLSTIGTGTLNCAIIRSSPYTGMIVLREDCNSEQFEKQDGQDIESYKGGRWGRYNI